MMSSDGTIEVKLHFRAPFIEGFNALADYDQIVEEDRKGYFETFIEMTILNILEEIAEEKKAFAEKNNPHRLPRSSKRCPAKAQGKS